MCPGDAAQPSTAIRSAELPLFLLYLFWPLRPAHSGPQRFFVIKDGFLLYYPEQKGTSQTFDMHPKGVVPLGGVEIETVRAGPKPALTSALRLSHPSFGAKSMLLCAADDSERDKWSTALQASSYM